MSSKRGLNVQSSCQQFFIKVWYITLPVSCGTIGRNGGRSQHITRAMISVTKQMANNSMFNSI